MCTDCNEITIPVGPPGPPGNNATIIVKDAQGNVVNNVSEIRFTDANALVSQVIAGVAKVNFTPLATVWNDVQNIPYYVAGSELFKPQYTIDGNKIVFRGMLFIPLVGGPNINNPNAYLYTSGSTLDISKMSIVTNSNTIGVGGEPQGRFFTTDVVNLPNLPPTATPVARDIVLDNIPAYRRHLGMNLSIFRSVVTLRIGSNLTISKNGINNGIGCISVYAPYQLEYSGGGEPPLGNDPLALSISNVAPDENVLDYINSLDNTPFIVPSAGRNSPFAVNAHNVTNLGGFIINLEGITGYLN